MKIGELRKTMIEFMARGCAFRKTLEGMILKTTRECDGRGTASGDLNYSHIDGSSESFSADHKFDF